MVWPLDINKNISEDHYSRYERVQQAAVELKIRYGSLETTIEKGLEQTWQYMDKCGTREGYLFIFNRSPGVSWDEKIFKQEKTFKNVNITVYGM